MALLEQQERRAPRALLDMVHPEKQGQLEKQGLLEKQGQLDMAQLEKQGRLDMAQLEKQARRALQAQQAPLELR